MIVLCHQATNMTYLYTYNKTYYRKGSHMFPLNNRRSWARHSGCSHLPRSRSMLCAKWRKGAALVADGSWVMICHDQNSPERGSSHTKHGLKWIQLFVKHRPWTHQRKMHQTCLGACSFCGKGCPIAAIEAFSESSDRPFCGKVMISLKHGAPKVPPGNPQWLFFQPATRPCWGWWWVVTRILRNEALHASIVSLLQ